MYMSTSSNVGRSCRVKPCSFAKCKRQMKYRCGEISVAAASGLLLGRSFSTCDRRRGDSASSFSCWEKHKLNIVLLKNSIITNKKTLGRVDLVHYLNRNRVKNL